MKRIILIGIALSSILSAAPPTSTTAPVSITDCYLLPDATRPTVRATPGLAGGSGGGIWRGAITLRNETNQELHLKGAVVHVLDGYGKPLFDIAPQCTARVACRSVTIFPLRADYLGGVSVFTFSCDVTVVGPDGQDQRVKLPPLDPASSGKPNKVPGY
ncbi:hypothetical protein IV102_22345 [bacterium]|nr:hypothetical protein [bacterium]